MRNKNSISRKGKLRKEEISRTKQMLRHLKLAADHLETVSELGLEGPCDWSREISKDFQRQSRRIYDNIKDCCEMGTITLEGEETLKILLSTQED